MHDMILGNTAECLRSKGARAKEDATPEILGAHCFPVLKTYRTMCLTPVSNFRCVLGEIRQTRLGAWALRCSTSAGVVSVALENDKPKRLTFQRAATPPPFLGHTPLFVGFCANAQ